MRLPRSGMNRRGFLRSLSGSALLASGLLVPACSTRRDTIHIIGSGITGLCAGALLAKHGHYVHVCESHPQLVGGHAAGFEQDGFRFCVGPQYVWNFRDDEIGIRVLRDLGLEDRVPFDSLDPEGFEEFHIGDEFGIKVPMGLDRFRDTAMDVFPDDYAGLDQFFSYLYDLHEGTRFINRHGLYMQGEYAIRLAFLLSCDLPPRVKRRFDQCSHWSLTELFNYCGLSGPARRFLYGHSGVFVENESDVSCVAYAAATGFYHAGADYPRFGFRSLVQALSDCITDAGGVVQTNKHVTALQRSGDRVTQIICSDGDSFATDLVISTASPRLTFTMLEAPGIWRAFYTPSNSVVSAFIGVRDYPGLPGQLARKNVWWQDGLEEVDFGLPDMTRPPRLLAVASPTCNGIHNTNADPEDHSLIVFAPGNFSQSADAYAQSPETHDELRAQITEQVLDRLEEYIFPGLRTFVRVIEVHTPHDLCLRTHGELGNAYGRRLTPADLLTKPYALSCVNNLHMACASTGMPGIATAFQTAALLTERITNRSVF